MKKERLDLFTFHHPTTNRKAAKCFVIPSVVGIAKYFVIQTPRVNYILFYTMDVSALAMIKNRVNPNISDELHIVRL